MLKNCDREILTADDDDDDAIVICHLDFVRLSTRSSSHEILPLGGEKRSRE